MFQNVRKFIISQKYIEALNALEELPISDLENLFFKNYLKAEIYYHLKKYSLSINLFKKSIKNNFRSSSCWLYLAIIFQIKSKKIVKKIIHILQNAKNLDDISLYDLAYLQDQNGMFDEGIKTISKIKKINNGSITTLLLSLKRKNGNIEDCLNIIKKNKHFFDHFDFLCEISSFFAYTEDYNEALKFINKAIEINPNENKIKFLKSLYLMHLNKYKEALKLFDYRFEKQVFEKYPRDENTWKGENIKKLFLWSEQGLGDHILYAKLIFEIKNVEKIYFETDVRIHELLKNYLKEKKITNIFLLDTKDKQDLKNFDAHLSCGSLLNFINPFQLQKLNYLKSLKKKVDSKNLKVGLSWKTGNTDQQFRNLPVNELFNCLKNIVNLEIHNLQFGKIENEILFAKKNNVKINILHNVNYKNNISVIADIINGLDVVVSCQNTVAHIASAMGKKTILLLPVGNRWYWKADSEQMDMWYKNTFIIKQKNIYDWSDEISQLTKKIIEYGKN